MATHIYEKREDEAIVRTPSGLGVPCRWCGVVEDAHDGKTVYGAGDMNVQMVSGQAPVEGAPLPEVDNSANEEAVVALAEEKPEPPKPKRKPAVKPAAKKAPAKKLAAKKAPAKKPALKKAKAKK